LVNYFTILPKKQIGLILAKYWILDEENAIDPAVLFVCPQELTL
jgi:hypothetical protein